MPYTMTRWACIVLLVGWPRAWRIADQIQLCRGQVVIGHRAPASRGVTKVLGWYHWQCNWGCLEGQHEGHNWSRWHWEWCQGCRLGWWHQGRWPQPHCWPGWYVCWSLLGCGWKRVRRGSRGITCGQGHWLERAQIFFLHQGEPSCCGHQRTVPRDWSGVW